MVNCRCKQKKCVFKKHFTPFTLPIGQKISDKNVRADNFYVKWVLLKVARWKVHLCMCSHHTANLNFLFLSLCVYLFKNCPSQFLSHWDSAEPVFCSEELGSLTYKNQNNSLILSYLVGKFKFAVCWDHINKLFFQWATFNQENFKKEL